MDSGEVIDSSADKGHLKFRLVEGQVQETWKVGIDGMQVGGKRRLTVPPWVSTKEGRGENIPPNSWLVFEVELVKVR
ncbi:peptidyl-prolyl cis-trans isomerase FKBP15-3-like [Hibiscus syriacus]|uniref:peptidyl-prolyl cis-trans isomerase FKBP15-3-like n=1 Tax=Hibiscus syriacus TaxID=106335 RepID=UPI001924499B|nr:peptidyl-prolyl cis-trans isomerase FKBP15-3-like [Hibiscus syriacus]